MDISVIGVGTWGTALALVLHQSGHTVTVYGRKEDRLEEIRDQREHPFLPGVEIPQDIFMTMDLREATRNDVLVMAIPSPYMRGVLEQIYALNKDVKKRIVNVAKGMEMATGLRLSQVVSEVTEGQYEYCILSGPTHAEEVARKKPAAIVAASEVPGFAREVQSWFSTDFLRVYENDDVPGVEIGGTLKNVIAIAAGVVDGLDYGDNSKAAIITRGLHEMSKFGVAEGAKRDTFGGLTGVGDLVVTCTSQHSRNRHYGEMLGKGYTREEIEKDMSMVAEGVFASKAVYSVAREHGISMPITEEVYKIIYEGADPKKSAYKFMERRQKTEMED